jgi:hypothetical protein
MLMGNMVGSRLVSVVQIGFKCRWMDPMRIRGETDEKDGLEGVTDL